MHSDVSIHSLKVRAFIALLALAVIVQTGTDAQAQPQFPFRSKETAPATLELTQNAGPWMVMCYSFSGDDGKQQAIRLATELRESFGLKAYTYTHHFDLTQKIRENSIVGWKYVPGREEEMMLIPEQMTSANDSNFEETAVLVGDFEAIDAPEAQQMLRNIKKLTPKSLLRAQSDELIRRYREIIQRNNYPLSHAMLLTNPMLPDEYFEKNGLDPFLIKMNKKVKFSLLDCPGKYSVRVATFRAKSTMSLAEIKQKQDELKWYEMKGKAIKSKLEQCYHNANVLTKELRKQGVEAYEFHDREESYVCVGSFEWLTRTDGNGNRTQNPAVRQTILDYRGTAKDANRSLRRRSQTDTDRMVNMITYPKVLPSLRNRKKGEEIVFDVQPLPVIVPKAPKTASKRIFGKFR